jgi:uncharacterized protein
MNAEPKTCTAFAGMRWIASGPLREIAVPVKAAFDRDDGAPVLIFDDPTSRLVEIDWRGTIAEVLARLTDVEVVAEPADLVRSPGRPKLGVTAREVTLLPRHWEWLGSQPGGASAALRRLVDAARLANADKDRRRQAQEATDRFMRVMAGDLPGYEEAARALYAGEPARFEALTMAWPTDVRRHARRLAETAFSGESKTVPLSV